VRFLCNVQIHHHHQHSSRCEPLIKKKWNTPRHAEKPKLFLDRNWLHGFLCLDVRKKNHTLNWTNKLIFRRRAQRALNENYYYTYTFILYGMCNFNTLQIWRCMSQFIIFYCLMYFCLSFTALSRQWNKHFMCALHNHVRNHVATMCFVLCKTLRNCFLIQKSHTVSA